MLIFLSLGRKTSFQLFDDNRYQTVNAISQLVYDTNRNYNLCDIGNLDHEDTT